MSNNTNIREWLRKENVFDNDIMKLLSQYGVINAPYDLRVITQNKWDQLFRKGLAEKSKELKSQTAKNRFEKKLKKVEKLWRIERKKIGNNENENEGKENTPIDDEAIKQSKQPKELTKSTVNWDQEYAEKKIEIQNAIDDKYQQTVNQKKHKQISDEKRSNNLRQWMRKEDVFDAYLLEIFGQKYCVYNPPNDFGKITQNEWNKIFRNSMAEKAKELKSQTAKNRFAKKLKKIEKIWRKQPRISKSQQLKEAKEAKEAKEVKQNEAKDNGLIQSESEVTLPKTVVAKESKKNKSKKRKKKKVKYMDLSDKMNIFVAIEKGDLKMLQTVQEYHIRNILTAKKGKINGLHYCCQYERPKMLKFLLVNNSKLVSKINNQNYLGNTPAFVAVIRMSEYESKWGCDYSFNCLKVLCDHDPDLNIRNLKGRTILMHTAMYNQIEIMKYLLSLKNIKDNSMRINMEIQDKQKQTAIMYAVKHSNYESVMILCSYGAKCDVKNITGHDVSHYASGKSKIFVDIQHIQNCIEGLKMVREIKMKQAINIPLELIYIIVHYVCDMGNQQNIENIESANELRDKTQNKLDKQHSKRIGKKQKRKEQRHVGPQTGADYKGWFAFG